MFGLFKRRGEEAAPPGAAPASMPAPTEIAPLAGPELIRAVRDEVRASAIDHQDLALAVLADIRAEQLDVAYDCTDIDQWILDYVKRAGLSADGVDLLKVRSIIKAQPGVTYKHRGIRTEDRFAGLRARLKRRRGHVPEKVWVFLISMDGFALKPGPEGISRVLVEEHSGKGLGGDRTRVGLAPDSADLAPHHRPIHRAQVAA